jgi:hypothetical protein
MKRTRLGRERKWDEFRRASVIYRKVGAKRSAKRERIERAENP